ncbi:MAG: hypothetical protein Kow0037_23830 [Calditrichia bacterium]
MLLLTLILFIVYLGFILWLENGLAGSSRKPPSKSTSPSAGPRFSVIIAAHNEAAVIRDTLKAILTQSYPPENFEVIVAADRCRDDTVEIVREFAGEYPNLNWVEISSIPDGTAPKKHALQKGIAKAKYSHLVMLDADCRPGPDFLQSYADYFQTGAEAVLGIPKIRWHSAAPHCYLLPERLIVWGTAAAAVGHQAPFLAFGGSWAYSKSAFERIGGFAQISQSLSGDDDLLVQRMSDAGIKVVMNWNPAGWVYTEAPQTWRELYRQRRRHHSAGKFYPKKLQAAYALFHLSELALYVMPLISPPAIIFLSGKWFLDLLALKRLAALFLESLGFRHIICYEIGALIHHGIIAPLSQIGQPRWGKRQ